MNLFGFNISRAPRSVAAVTKSLGPDSDAWLKGSDLASAGAVLSNAYQQVVWVYRAINVLAEQIGNIPFLFSSGDRGRENLITHGPLVDFYDHPHPQINRFQYWELRIIWLMLRGECFRIPIYSDDPNLNPNRSRSSPRRLHRILLADPAHFQHIIEDHQLIGWRYTGFGRQTPLASQVFLPEEVWFEKLPNPFNFWRGLAPLQVAGLAAQTDFAAAAFMKGVMENNGDLGLIVRVKDQIGPEQREQLSAALRERKRRAGTADEPLLLWNTTDIVQPQLSSSDLQFLENRKFSRAEICAAFGVPEEIVTTTDNSKYDVMQGARLNFIEHRVAPLCRRLEAGEDAIVKSLDSRAVGWFDLDSLPIMQAAQRDRLATARTVFDMGVPFNELNRVLDLGFRRLPWGDRAYVASKLTEVGAGQDPAVRTPDAGSIASQTGITAIELSRLPIESPVSSPSPPREERAGERRPFNATSGQAPNLSIKSSSLRLFSELFSSPPALEPVERISKLLAEIQTQSAETGAPGEQPTPVPIHFAKEHHPERMEITQPGVARNELPRDNVASASNSERVASPPRSSRRDHQLASKLHRFFFEQRARVLASLVKVGQAGCLPPSSTTHRSSSNPLFDALPDPEHAAALVLPPQLTPEDAAALRQRLITETQTLRETVAASLEEGLRQGEQREQLAERVRAIYNQAISQLVHRIVNIQ